MAFKQITVYFALSQQLIHELKIEYPNIIVEVFYETNKTTLIVNVTPSQQAQIIPTIKDKMIRVEDVVWPPV